MNVHYANSTALHSFLTATLTIRKWERANVPFLSPQIALDIAIYAARCGWSSASSRPRTST